MGPRSGQGILVAAWYAGLTALALAFAYRTRALTRAHGAVIIGGYLVFVAALIVSTVEGGVSVPVAIAPALAVGAAGLLALAGPQGLATATGRLRAAAGATRTAAARAAAQRSWLASVAVCLVVTVIDAATGHRLILMALLALGPCCALATGHWRRTATTGVLALSLGVLLGIPDQVFATYIQYASLAVIAAAASTAGAAVLQHRRTV